MAAQSGGSALSDAAAVPMVDGRADNRTEKIRQASKASRIHGMILCKTEKFSSSFSGFQTAASGQCRDVRRVSWGVSAAERAASPIGERLSREPAWRGEIRRRSYRHYDGRRRGSNS